MKNQHSIQKPNNNSVFTDTRFYLASALFLTLFNFGLYAQTGPGGVGNRDAEDKLVLWLTASEGITMDANNYVSVWSDGSGYGNDAHQDLSKRPQYTEAAINGFPALNFDGVNDQMTIGGHASLEPDYITIFAVCKRDRTGWGDIITRPYSDNNSWNYPYTSYTLNSCCSFWGSSQRKPFSQCVVSGDKIVNWDPPHDEVPDATPYIHAMVYNGQGMGSYLNNASSPGYGDYISAPGVLDYNDNHAVIAIGTHSSYITSPLAFDHFLKGQLAEVVIYNEALSEVDHIIVANAFAAKYNITIGWDKYAEQTGFVYDVIGIGKDDDDQHLVSKGGSLSLEAASFSENVSYVFAGHNNLSTAKTTINVPVGYNNRMERTWYIASTGTLPSTVTLTFQQDYAPGQDAGNYGLLFSANSDMSAAGEVMKATLVNVAEKTVTFNVDAAGLSNGYYTLGSTKNHWNGQINSLWNTAANWENHEMPGSGSNVVIIANPVDDHHAEMSDAELFTVYDIVIEDGATLTIGAGTTLETVGQLTNLGNASSLVLASDATGSGGIIQNSANVVATIQRYLSQSKYHYISTPVTNQAISPEFINTLTNPLPESVDFYKYDEPQSMWINIKDGEGNLNASFETTFADCRGYAVANNDDDKTRNFQGILNTDDQDVAISRAPGKGLEGWNIVGNPFPVPLALNDAADAINNLLTINQSVLDEEYGAVYFWDESEDYNGTSNDYVAVNQASEAAFLSVGQAFMVKAAGDGLNFSFEKVCRKHGDADFYKTKEDDFLRLWFTLTDPLGNINKTLLAFSEFTSLGLDVGYDSKKFKANPHIALYSLLADGSEGEFAIQSLPLGLSELSVPVGIEVLQPGACQIQCAGAAEFGGDTEVFLVDKSLNISTDLQKTDTYEFSTPGSCVNHHRFEVLIRKNGASIQDPDADMNIHIAWEGNQIKLKNPENKKLRVGIYNITGQLVISKSNITKTVSTLDVSGLPRGIYLVSASSGHKVFTKKLLVN